MRILSIMIGAIMGESFIAPFNATTAFALDVPQPIYPENYADTTPYTDPPLGIPLFQWSVVAGATKYRLQADNVSDFTTPIMNITTQNSSYAPASTSHLFSDGIWYWRVRVENPTPVGEWSDMQFTKTWAV